jgi:hypothetical protein
MADKEKKLKTASLEIDPTSFRFVEILLSVFLGWVLISFWERFFVNFFFQTLQFSPTNTWHTLIVALILSVALVFFLMWMGEDGTTMVQNISGIFAAPGNVQDFNN